MEEKAFGNRLKTAREAKGWSLEKISDELRIPVKFLDGMERDDYTGFPGPTYEKAFLRTYSKHLGVNSDELMAFYKELRGEKKSPAGKEPEKELTPEKTHFASRKKQQFKIPEAAKYWVLAALALALIVFSVLAVRQCSTAGGAGGGSSGAAGSPQPKLVLTADVTDECWFEIVTDNEPANKMMLKAGDKKKWEANNEFVIVNIGNKDALKLELDGKPVDLGLHRGKTIKDLTLKREVAKDGK